MSCARNVRSDALSDTGAMDEVDPTADADGPSVAALPLFVDVTTTHLPSGLDGFSMDARPADIDGDGDLDLVIASEKRRNILLINRGDGTFEDARDRLPDTRRDSEDVVIHDFDGDGDLDLFFASEDDQTNELFLSQGAAFVAAPDEFIPVAGTSNAAILDESVDPPLVLLGNAGQNKAIQWSKTAGRFVDVTDRFLPARIDKTQDLELGDIDGDGDLDLAVGNEDASVILLRENGRFQTVVPLPADSETREVDLFDADGDGDLDVVLANIRFLRRRPRQNRLLLQVAPRVFEDRTTEARAGQPRLPADDDDTFDIDPIDVDGDGDLDLISANLDALAGRPANAPYRVYLNDGAGFFVLAERVLPSTAVGNGFDIEWADFNGDQRPDLFLASRGGSDRLLLAR